MRTFVVYIRTGSTSSFRLDDLPSSGGRMDLAARCVNSSLWLSRALRHDTRVYLVLNGPPDPPKTVEFVGSTLVNVSPDERNIAAWMLKAVKVPLRGKDWVAVQQGLRVSKRSFQELLKELKGPFYIMHERGKDIRNSEIAENPVFVLGDHVGLPKIEEKFVERFKPGRLSLGRISYLASQCITIVHNELDRR